MCFSPSASFTAATILALIGIKSITDSKKSTRLLACIPLLFAAQQLSEGIVWFTLLHSQEHTFAQLAPYIFLFFAMVLWPVWVPLSMMPLIKTKTRNIAYITLGSGIILAAYQLVNILYFGVSAQIMDHHILYRVESPAQFYWLGTLLYLIATLVPWFLTNNRLLWLLGILIATSYTISYIFYTEFLISIWCFFAAILSVIIVFAVRRHR